MTSAIDPTKPPAGYAYTADVRANFAAAKSEIEGLQSDLAAMTYAISFPFVMRPQGSIAVAVPWPLTIPASLAGTVASCVTNPTASATFTVNRVRSGATTALGTVAIATNGTALLSGSGGDLVAGDLLQVVAPAVTDTTLRDLSITVAATWAG